MIGSVGRSLGRMAVLVRVVLLATAMAAPASAAVIYRWTDKQGQTHFADGVPDEYKAVAKPIGTTTPSPPAAVPSRPSAPAAKDRVPARPAASAPEAPAADGARPPAGAVTARAAKRPPFAPTEDTDCATWRRLLRESQDCFGPFRTVRGATKAQAFEQCTVVSEPPARCGPARD